MEVEISSVLSTELIVLNVEVFVLCGDITKFDIISSLFVLLLSGKLTVRVLYSWISWGGVTSLFLLTELFPKSSIKPCTQHSTPSMRRETIQAQHSTET